MQRTTGPMLAVMLISALAIGISGAALGMAWTGSQYSETLDYSVSIIDGLAARVQSQEDELVYLRNNDRCTEHVDEEPVPLGPMDDESVTGSTGDALAGATSVAGGVTSNANG